MDNQTKLSLKQRHQLGIRYLPFDNEKNSKSKEREQKTKQNNKDKSSVLSYIIPSLS